MTVEIDEFTLKRIKHCEAMIGAIEATIEGRVIKDIESVEVNTGAGTRKLTKISASELIKIRINYIKELQALKEATGQAKSGRRVVLPRFL